MLILLTCRLITVVPSVMQVLPLKVSGIAEQIIQVGPVSSEFLFGKIKVLYACLNELYKGDHPLKRSGGMLLHLVR